MNDRGMNMRDLDRHITGGGSPGIEEAPYEYNHCRPLDCRNGPSVYAYGRTDDKCVSLHWTQGGTSGGIYIAASEARQLADMLNGAADLAEGLARLPEDAE